MKTDNRLFFLLFILGICSCKANQISIDESSEINHLDTEIFSFPEDWIGNYGGVLEVYSREKKVRELEMELTIGQEDSLGYFPWILKYGDKDIRSYAIKKDSLVGRYVFDEYNGIVIESYKLGPKFVSHFSVSSNEIISITEKKSDHLLFEIYSSSTDTLSNTHTIEEGMRFDVASFPVKVYQKAVLRNKKTLSK